MLNQQDFSHVIERAALDAIAAKGVDGSGAYNHYRVLAQEARMFNGQQARFVEFIQENVSPDTIIHELGDGAGITSLALYTCGYRCVNLCPDVQRAVFSEFLARRLKEHNAIEAVQYRILKELFPSSTTKLLQQRDVGAVFVSYDSVHEQFAKQEGSVIENATAYPQMVINLARFVRNRNTEALQDELISMFARRGHTPRHMEPFSTTCRQVWFVRTS